MVSITCSSWSRNTVTGLLDREQKQVQIEELKQQLEELKKLLIAKEETVAYLTRLVETQKELIEKLKEDSQ